MATLAILIGFVLILAVALTALTLVLGASRE